MIKAGLITRDEIHGNAQADVLAKKGADTYALPEVVQTAIRYRTKVTKLVQNMMVAIWTKKRKDEKDLKDAIALQQEEDELAQHIFAAQHDHHLDDEYDPFDFGIDEDSSIHTTTQQNQWQSDTPTTKTNTNGNLQDIENQPAHNGEDEQEENANYDTHDDQHLYPGYAWTNAHDEADTNICAKVAELEHVLQKHKNDRFQVPLIQREKMEKKQRRIGQHATGSSHIDYDMWEPLASWLQTLTWTASSSEDGTFKKRSRRSSTWCELTMAFQLQTGYNIKSSSTPLATQLACFKAAFLRLARDSRICKFGNGKTFNDNFAPKCKVPALRALTGEDLPGIQRRPILDDYVWQHIGTNVIAMMESDTKQTEHQPAYTIQYYNKKQRPK